MSISCLINGYNERCRCLKDEREALDKKIQTHLRQIERLENRRMKLMETRPNWVDEVAKPLGDLLAEQTGKYAYVCGPQGIRSAVTIYLMDDRSKSIIDHESLSITIIPDFEGDNMVFRYETGEKENDFAPGSIGYINGMNNVTAELSDNMEKILKLLVHNDPFGRYCVKKENDF